MSAPDEDEAAARWRTIVKSDLASYPRRPMTRICGRCGQPADGYAQINDTWYCHPDDETKPDCYALAWNPEQDLGRWMGDLP